MKKTIIVFLSLTGILLFLFSGCGSKGGTITLINESSFALSDPYISMGESSKKTLKPGEWMKASYDKDQSGFNVRFTLTNGKNLVNVTGLNTFQWTLFDSLFTANSSIAVNGGAEVIVRVQNIQE